MSSGDSPALPLAVFRDAAGNSAEVITRNNLKDYSARTRGSTNSGQLLSHVMWDIAYAGDPDPYIFFDEEGRPRGIRADRALDLAGRLATGEVKVKEVGTTAIDLLTAYCIDMAQASDAVPAPPSFT